MTTLTARSIAAFRPAEKPYKRSDGKGLYIDVRPDGAKYWRMAYRYRRKQKLLALGVYPEVSLADARAGCDTAKRDLARGVDPMDSRRTASSKIYKSFELIAREWMANFSIYIPPP
jgi:hypothetical protein